MQPLHYHIGSSCRFTEVINQALRLSSVFLFNAVLHLWGLDKIRCRAGKYHLLFCFPSTWQPSNLTWFPVMRLLSSGGDTTKDVDSSGRICSLLFWTECLRRKDISCQLLAEVIGLKDNWVWFTANYVGCSLCAMGTDGIALSVSGQEDKTQRILCSMRLLGSTFPAR